MSKIFGAVCRPQSLLASSLFAAALNMGASHQALAACSNNPPTAGQTVDCTGLGNAAVIAPTEVTSGVGGTSGIGGSTGVTVNVEAGASITGVGLSALGASTSGTPPVTTLNPATNQYSSISVNDSSTVNIAKTAIVNPTLGSQVRDYVGVNLNGSNTSLVNNGTISINNDPAAAGSNSFRLYGVITSVPGLAPDDTSFENVHVTNNGTIDIQQRATGIARGIYAGEGIDSMTIDNSGTINVTRASGVGSVNSTAVGGIDADDDVDELTVNNHKTGTISASGTNTFAVGGRAQDYTLINDGTITDTTGRAAIVIYGGGDGAPSETTISNSQTGVVNGNVVISDGNPLAISGPLGNPPSSATGSAGTRNSDITNAGTIIGSVTLASGIHTLDNSGTITNGISVRQTAPVGVGGASFTLTNEGILGGDISITDRSDSVNSIALSGTGFSGSILASTGTGDNSVSFQNDLSITRIQNFRTLDLSGSAVTVTGPVGVSLQAGATINTTITGTGTTDLGNLKFTGAGGTLALAGQTTITPTAGTIVSSGSVFQVASSVTGGSVEATDTALVDWTATETSGKLLLSADVADVSTIANISKPGIATLNALFGSAGSDPSLDALGGAVQSLADAGDVRKAASQLAPETNYATQQAAITLNNVIGQHIDTRLSAVGATGAFQGYTSGPYGLGVKPQESDPNRSNLGGSLKDDAEFVAPRSAALWGQAFGAGLDQDQRDQVDGYNARIYGVMVGYDNWISPGLRVGIAGGYANTSIDGSGDTGQNETSIDSYLIEAYGAFKGDGWYAIGRTGFTWHDYDTTRVMTVPFTDSATGSHDGDQFNVSFEVGAPMKFSGSIITPVAGLTYSRLHQDSYSERSDGGMALDVGSQDNDSLVSSLGFKGLVPIANDTVIEGRALWLHEFSDDSQIVTASFAGGGGTFTAAGPGVGRDTADLGVGMLAQIGSNSTFEINYDANVREDYLGHIGSARVDINF